MNSRFEEQPIATPKAKDPFYDKLNQAVSDLSAQQRIAFAREVARWTEQLEESAYKMDPKLRPKQATKKIPRGFFLVNLSGWEQKELRALARECGIELRLVIAWAVRDVRSMLDDKIKIARKLGVKPQECWSFIHADPRN